MQNDAPPVQIRFPSELLSSIENWRREQLDIPTRPEAIRRLLGQALLGRSMAGSQETKTT